MTLCSIPACERQARRRGMCPTHYTAWRCAQPDAPRCVHLGCEKAAIAKGFCGNHYGQARRADRSRPRCTLPGCDTPVSSCGMCYKHDAACRRYGLTRDQYEALIIRSAGACAICEEVPTGTLYVDHDHDTGAVRGLLCSHCNFLLGNARNSPDRLLAAAAYLMESQSVLGSIQ